MFLKKLLSVSSIPVPHKLMLQNGQKFLPAVKSLSKTLLLYKLIEKT